MSTRALLRGLWAGASVVLLAASAAVVIGAVAGWRPVALLTGSMTPTAPAGSLVVVAPVDGAHVRVGDIVTVRWASASTPVTHRVVDVTRDASGARIATTRGDANDDVDQQVTRLDGRRVYVARYVIPDGARWIAGRTPRLALGGTAVVGGLVGLGIVWRPNRRRWAAPPTGC